MVYDLVTARPVSPLTILLFVSCIVALVFTAIDWPKTRRARIAICILAGLLGLAGSVWYGVR